MSGFARSALRSSSGITLYFDASSSKLTGLRSGIGNTSRGTSSRFGMSPPSVHCER